MKIHRFVKQRDACNPFRFYRNFTIMRITIFVLLGIIGLHAAAQQPNCELALAKVNTDSLVFFVKNITGKQPVVINNQPKVISSRYATHPGNNLAAEYLKQTVMGYGWMVEDIPFSSSGRNIIAYKPGTLNPKQAYLVGAHYDCVGNTTMDFEGADDNASGVAALLETARVLQTETFPYTIVLAFWDEEELGLLGSEAFAPDGPVGYWDIKASINLDMIGYDGNGDSLAMVHTFNSGYSEIFATKMKEVNRLYNTGLNIFIKNPGDKATDHQSFWLKGSTAIGLTEDYDDDFTPHWHQLSDSLGNMDIPYFTKMSKLAFAAICEITQTGNFVAVQELVFRHLSIYPNPVTNLIELPNTIDWQNSECEVYTIMGAKVLVASVISNKIDVSALPPGLYTLLLIHHESTYTSRILKQ
jgi:hypothetical protein